MNLRFFDAGGGCGGRGTARRDVAVLLAVLLFSLSVLFGLPESAGDGVIQPAADAGGELFSAEDMPAEGIFSIRGREIPVAFADSETERTRGLSGRAFLPEGSGLFFVFPESRRWGIWMKEMQFPIDVVWLDEELAVVALRSRIALETFPEVFYPSGGARYALELNAGEASRIGIAPGDRGVIRYKFLAQ